MSSRFVSGRTRPRASTLTVGGGIAAVALLVIVLAAAGVFSGGSSTLGTVKIQNTAAKTPATPNA